MVVSKNTWMVHEGFNPQIARTFCCLMFVFEVIFLIVFDDLCIKNSPNITGAIFIVFSPRKPGGWESALVSITLLGWGGWGWSRFQFRPQKSKGNISNIRWLGGYLSPWLFSLWGMNVECRIVQRDTRPWYHTIISIIHDVSWNLMFFHKEPATVLESFCTSMTRSIWVTGAETVECKKPSQLKWL